MLEQSYPREKMTTAVSILVTHPGRIKERLFDAYIEFHTIGEDMPQPFQWRLSVDRSGAEQAM